MTRTEARLILSKSLLSKDDGGPAEREALMTLACAALDDLESMTNSFVKIADQLEQYRKGIRS